MGIFDNKRKLSNEFIDIIEWLDYTPDTICRFERYQNEIKTTQNSSREGRPQFFYKRNWQTFLSRNLHVEHPKP